MHIKVGKDVIGEESNNQKVDELVFESYDHPICPDHPYPTAIFSDSFGRPGFGIGVSSKTKSVFTEITPDNKWYGFFHEVYQPLCKQLFDGGK